MHTYLYQNSGYSYRYRRRDEGHWEYQMKGTGLETWSGWMILRCHVIEEPGVRIQLVQLTVEAEKSDAS